MAVETPGATEPTAPSAELTVRAETADKPSGPAAAVMLAAGIGILTLGIVTTVNEASASFHSFLTWDDGVGPLSGKTGLAMAAFFGSWALLTALWRRSNPALKPIAIATAVLVFLGLVGTFPTFFMEFASE